MAYLKHLILTVFIAGFLTAHAQNGASFGGFEFLPQRVEANPAFRPIAKINVAIPALGNIHFNHHNNWIRPDVGFGDAGTGRSVFDAQAMLNQIGDAAVTSQEISVNLLHVGMRIKEHYFHVSINERVGMRVSLPADLFYLAVYGNAGSHQFADHTANFTDLAVDAMHFREYAFGYSRNIGENWTVGATAKYLYGMENIRTEKSTLKLRTDPNTYALQTSGSMVVRTSGLGIDDDGRDHGFSHYAFGRNNGGAALDVGAVFRPIEKLSVSASIHDLGWIRWNNDVTNYGTDNADFLHDGFDVSDYLFAENGSFSDSLSDQLDAFIDDLEDRYGIDATHEAYTTALNGYARYGAEYELWQNKKLRGKATLDVVHGLGGGYIPFRTTVGYVQQVGHVLEAGVNLGKRSGASWGLGAGFAVNAGFFQLFAMVDNLNVARLIEVTHISTNGDRDQFNVPANTDDVRFSLGMNLTFGRKTEMTAERRFVD